MIYSKDTTFDLTNLVQLTGVEVEPKIAAILHSDGLCTDSPILIERYEKTKAGIIRHYEDVEHISSDLGGFYRVSIVMHHSGKHGVTGMVSLI